MEAYVESRRTVGGRVFDVAAPSGDSGIAVLAVRKNTAAPLADTDGDYTPLQTDSTGALRITGSISTTSAGPYVVDSAFAGTHTGMPAFAVQKTTGASLVNADGDYTPLQTDANGSLRVVAVGTTAVSGAVTVSGTVTTNGPYVVDAVHGAGHTGMPAFAVQKTTGASLVNADGDYTPLQTDANGSLRVVATGTTAVSGAVTVSGTATVSGTVTANGPYVIDAAHGAGHTGMPAFAVQKTTGASLVNADGDYTPLQTDSAGALRVVTTNPISSSALNSAVALSASAINVRPLDFGLMVQRGLYTDMSFINVYGRNTNAALLTIWPVPTSYSTPAGAQLLNVVSNNVADNSSGNGARTVFIEGLDGNYDIVSETITMNGVTTVVTTNQYIALNNVYVATAGSTQWAEGNITFTQQSGGRQLATIRANINVAESTVYTVPRGYTAFINELFITGFNTTSNTTCHVALQTKTSSGVFLTQTLIILMGNLVNHLDKRFSAPIVVPERSVIMFRSIAASGGGTWDVAVNYGVLLIKNS